MSLHAPPPLSLSLQERYAHRSMLGERHILESEFFALYRDISAAIASHAAFEEKICFDWGMLVPSTNDGGEASGAPKSVSRAWKQRRAVLGHFSSAVLAASKDEDDDGAEQEEGEGSNGRGAVSGSGLGASPVSAAVRKRSRAGPPRGPANAQSIDAQLDAEERQRWHRK